MLSPFSAQAPLLGTLMGSHAFLIWQALLDALLTYDPRRRICAREAAAHEYFRRRPATGLEPCLCLSCTVLCAAVGDRPLPQPPQFVSAARLPGNAQAEA